MSWCAAGMLPATAEADKAAVDAGRHDGVHVGHHEGDGCVTFQQWDGKTWNPLSDWIALDWALLRPIVEKSSEAYAKEMGLSIGTAEDADKVSQQLRWATPSRGHLFRWERRDVLGHP